MANQPHYFNLDEANAIVKAIRPLMAEILGIRQHIIAQQAELWPIVEKAAGNGGNRIASLAVREFGQLDRLVHEIQVTGAIIKDLNAGLVDFPALRDGREIYLCWKYDEKQIEFWHDVSSGYSGRQPLA